MSANIEVLETAPLERELATEQSNQAKKALSMSAPQKTGFHGTQFPRSPSAPLAGKPVFSGLGMEIYILLTFTESRAVPRSHTCLTLGNAKFSRCWSGE